MRYFAKWKKMPWWSTMHMLKRRNKLVHDEFYQAVAPHLGNMEHLSDIINPDIYKSRSARKNRIIENRKFLETFLIKFPELRLAEIGDIDEMETRNNDLTRLVQYFKKLVKDGMEEKAALNHIETMYKDYVDEKRKNFSLANNLAANNNVRSVLDVYSQKAEAEARMKVARLRRDQEMYAFLENEDLPKYQRHMKLVNKSHQSGQTNQEKPTLDQAMQDFFSRSSNLLNSYYEDAFTKDGLSNLNHLELYYNLKETPNRIKKRCKQILKKLDENNVYLTPTGSLDWSNCTNKYFRDKFENNAWVKYAALQREMDYGYPHLEHQRMAAAELKKNIMNTKAKYTSINEAEAKKSDKLIMEDTASKIDKLMDFDFKGDLPPPLTIEDNASAIQNDELINGGAYRLDQDNLLIEPFEERIARLEGRWYRERMMNLEGGLEELSEEELVYRRNLVIEKLRRIKLQVERQAIEQGMDRFFEEHQQLQEEKLMMESIPLDRLINYYQLPRDVKQGSPEDQLEYERSIKAMVPKEMVEELYDGSSMNAEQMKTIEDTIEYKNGISDRQKKNEMESEKYQSFEQAMQDREMDKSRIVEEDLSRGKQSKYRKTKKNITAIKKQESEGAQLLKFLRKKI